MDLTWSWLLLGAAAFILVFVNLIRWMMEKHRGWQTLLFASLSCGTLAVLRALLAVHYWARKRNWSAVEDVLPVLTGICTIAVIGGVILNLLALWLHLQAEKIRKEAETDGKS